MSDLDDLFEEALRNPVVRAAYEDNKLRRDPSNWLFDTTSIPSGYLAGIVFRPFWEESSQFEERYIEEDLLHVFPDFNLVELRESFFYFEGTEDELITYLTDFGMTQTHLF